MYLIFSGNTEEFSACIKQIGIDPSKAMFLSDALLLRGATDVHILFYGTFRTRKRYIDVLEFVRENRTCSRIDTTIVTEGMTQVPRLRGEQDEEEPLQQYINSKYKYPLNDTVV